MIIARTSSSPPIRSSLFLISLEDRFADQPDLCNCGYCRRSKRLKLRRIFSVLHPTSPNRSFVGTAQRSTMSRLTRYAERELSLINIENQVDSKKLTTQIKKHLKNVSSRTISRVGDWVKLRLLIVLALCVGAASAFGQTLPEKVTPIIQEVDGLSETKTATDRALRTLQISLEAYLSNQPDGDQAVALQAAIGIIEKGAPNIAQDVEKLRVAVEEYQDDFLSSHILRLTTSLSAAITNYGTAEYSHDVLQELSSLAGVIETLEMRRSVYAVSAWATRLNSLIATGLPANKQPEADIAARFALTELVALRATLLAREGEHDPQALSRRIVEVKTLLSQTGAEKAALTSSDYRTLSQLRDSINTRLGEGLITGIHIISAEYGHIGGDRSGGRCSVTATVRKACQQSGTCTAFTKETFVGLCGGKDPAPFAPSSERGIRVRYNCLTATEPYWRSTVSASQSSSHGSSAQYATLRSPADTIVCNRPEGLP